MKAARIAALRPLMPIDDLARIMSRHWATPDAQGFVPDTWSHGFGAQMEIGGRIGRISFYKSFPADFLIEALHIRMPLAEALVAQPGLQAVDNGPDDLPEWTQYRVRLAAGHDLLARVKDGVILAIEISHPEAVYPQPPRLLADPTLTSAWDLLREPQQTLPSGQRGAEWAGGWSLGLPPGISPGQWPLSPLYGYPLRHAFTLNLPAEYRAQGEAFVALSLFVDDQFEELEPSEVIEAFFSQPLSTEPPSDSRLLPFWQHRHARHPQRFDMTDLLGTHYVAIWLTQEAFDAPLCQPPQLEGHPLLGQPPRWLHTSYAEYLGHDRVRNPGAPAYEWLSGEGRAAGIDTAFAIRAQRREGDPNVGKPPREWDEQCKDSGYIQAFSEAGQARDLARWHAHNHLGGTMFPVQGYPEFGPRYLEIEEDFGGFNFGGGNGQIDLSRMNLDWACG